MMTSKRLVPMLTWIVLALAVGSVLMGCDWGGGGPGSSGPFNL